MSDLKQFDLDLQKQSLRLKYDEENNFFTLRPLSPYVQSKIQSWIVPELKNHYYPQKPLVPLIQVTHDRLVVEVMRGCTEGCLYCNAGMIYRPVRERNEDEIVALRLDGFSEQIAEFAKTVRKSGLTFAPEAGSMRLRRVINKNISDDDLIKATDIALKNGWKNIGLYLYFTLKRHNPKKEKFYASQNTDSYSFIF